MKTENKKHNTLHIPTREEFHRYASNLLSESDFCTDYSGYPDVQASKVEAAIKWTLKIEQKR